MKQIVILLLALFCLSSLGLSQPYKVEIYITNQPDNYIIFGSVKGDDFTPIDSSFLYPQKQNIIFKFHANAHPGVYRVVFGKTPYARVMNELPQQLDFIFNNENVIFKTNFKDPLLKLEVVESAENKAWFNFLKQDMILQQKLTNLKNQLDRYWLNADSTNAIKLASEYNMLQMERDFFVLQTSGQSRDLLASKIITNRRKPIYDAYLSSAENIQLFKNQYFNGLDFSDERLIQSSVYTDNVFEYLVSYNSPEFTMEQRELEYIKAVDVIVENVNKNKLVYDFILDYLLHGFESLKLNKVNAYISEKYIDGR